MGIGKEKSVELQTHIRTHVVIIEFWIFERPFIQFLVFLRNNRPKNENEV